MGLRLLRFITGEEENVNIDELFKGIETRIIDVTTGEYADDKVDDVAAYDMRRAAKVIGSSVPVKNQMAGLARVARYKIVYLVKEANKLKRVILPVHGKGLWSTMYGFLALGTDLKTIKSFAFYEHGETPGLGGEVDNPRWISQWTGKLAYNDQWEVKIKVLKGKVQPSSKHKHHQIDGLGGSTLTTNGIDRLIRFWLGHAKDEGYGPYLQRLRQGGRTNG